MARLGKLLFLFLVSELLGSFVFGRFVVEKSSISVLSPLSLRSKHDSAIGNFGLPDYGGFLVGSAMYHEKEGLGCQPFDGDKPFRSKTPRPTILLLDRGECYFALKVWNAQQAGAAAVLVVDRIDEPLITMDSPEASGNSQGTGFWEGYQGKDVVYENLRQLCVHRVANESSQSWVWWDYVTDFHIRCSMKNKRYSKECAEEVLKSLDLPIDKIKKCMGDPEADVENEVLKTEQELQVGRGSRGDVTILPTLVINNVQYRGKLERTAVLKAICSGFKETTDPPICLSSDLETNECLERNGGCWQDNISNVTACKDTFRGRICECPVVKGVQYKGDGYASCEDINECKERTACQCDGCSCKNTWGSYECKCKGDLLYIKEQDACIERNGSKFGWFLTFVVVAVVGGAGVAGYIFYKYRLRSYMDSEIMAIMSQYMPLDNQHNNEVPAEVQPLRQGTSV
ncbi:hypothetical protein GH714_032530 [Hevea brasiliensis]|uniref:EGF-like calcium-binding domain-containing protein n=1 Tax=Hevea brasiliensis TaxID=3981 RepID=A0A6A6KP91_HEVBR|nr:hypothetical protein GH714_032530 [Hevea brasiliensis]